MFDLKNERMRVGLSQATLAEMLGVTGNYLCMVEKGKREMSLPLVTLAKKIFKEKEEMLNSVRFSNQNTQVKIEEESNTQKSVDEFSVCPSCKKPVNDDGEEIQQCVRSNNMMLSNIVKRMQLFAKGLDALQTIEKEVSTRVKTIVDAQTEDLKATYKKHINEHVYVILSALKVVTTMVRCSDDENKKEVLSMIGDIQSYVTNMKIE